MESVLTNCMEVKLLHTRNNCSIYKLAFGLWDKIHTYTECFGQNYMRIEGLFAIRLEYRHTNKHRQDINIIKVALKV